MVDDRHETALVATGTTVVPVALRNKTFNVSAIRAGQHGAADYVSHLTPGDVKLMAAAATRNKRHGDRNAELIKFMYDSTLRVSETLSARPCDILNDSDGWLVKVMGKGSKAGTVAITPETAATIQAYCYRAGIAPTDRIFPFTRSQAFRIVSDAYEKSGVRRPNKVFDHVGAIHVLRHSGAIARLKASGNPRSVQHQLRHRSAATTLKYLKTLSADESLAIQQGVNPW